MLRTFFALCMVLPLLAQKEKPIALYAGMGVEHRPIGTSNAEAQKYFDQGMALMYGFNRYDAVRSFRKATELDPKAAMAWWGVSQAFGPYINMNGDPSVDMKESCAAAAKGLAIAGLSSADRAWLEASRSRCPDFADPEKYIAAMRSLAAKYPDDPDAQTLFADALMLPDRWRWYSGEGKPSAHIEEAERVLETVLRRDANHGGANHLYIHAVESSPTPQRGVASSLKLMGIVPGAGHVVHMPAHIWLVLGEFQTAAEVNERAAAVDREYFAKSGVTGTYYPYYLHNLSFVMYARDQQGRGAEARKAEQQMAGAAGAMAAVMPGMAEALDGVITFSKLRTNRWAEVLALPAPKTDAPLPAALFHYSRGVAFALTKHPEEARREQVEFEKARNTVDPNGDWGTNKNGDVMNLAAVVLDARVQPSAAAAVPLWREAVRLQDALGYDEPPAWYYPTRESLGGALLLSGDAAGAEAVFREALKRSPNNGHVLFGLLESLKAQKKDDAAAWVEREFQKAWRGADVLLRVPEL